MFTHMRFFKIKAAQKTCFMFSSLQGLIVCCTMLTCYCCCFCCCRCCCLCCGKCKIPDDVDENYQDDDPEELWAQAGTELDRGERRGLSV